jgi:hypothetical protein
VSGEPGALQDRITFRVELSGALFGFIAAVTGIIALIVAMNV